MIVTCTSCQARFRIADEKIGPKGAKVRCSKCRNVFVAKPAAGAGEPMAAKDPLAGGLPGAGGPAATAADPFAAAQADPFADPFAAPAPGPSGPDPVAAPAPPGASKTGAHHLPVTDLSDLAGGVAAAPFPAGLTSLAPPLPAAPASPAGTQGEAAGSVANADDLVLEEPSRAIPMAPPPLPSAAPAFDFGMGGELAEPLPPELAGPAPSFEFGFPGTDLGEGSEPASGLELAGSGEAVLGGAASASAGADPFLAKGAAAPFGAEHAPEMGGLRIPTITEPIPSEKAHPPAPAQPAIPPRRKAGAGPLSAPPPRSRLQGFLASAVSLAALLAVAAGLLSWWLRDAAAPDAVGRGPVVASGVRGGLYEAAGGRPVLFVRGEVKSRSDQPLGRVSVRAEVLLGGEVGARAEGIAGALPTPEEVAQIGGPEDAARLRARVAARAPQRLEAGASLPFLVIFDAVPEGLRDAVFRVVAEARPAGPARAP